MVTVILNTEDGEFLYTKKVDKMPPDLIIWHKRYFVKDRDYPLLNQATFTETDVLVLW